MSKPKKRGSAFLLIDIGNTNTDFAVATQKKIQKVLTVPTSKLSKLPVSTKNIEGVALASVVPAVTREIIRLLPMKPLVVGANVELGIRLRYPNKKQLGADRLANVVAASKLYKTPAIVIDFGTAATFDVINQKKEFVGGIIVPGIFAMNDYLNQKTALLPSITLAEPKSIIAKSTANAIRAGVVLGYRGLVKEIIGELMKQPGLRNAVVIATGGDGKRIARMVPSIQIVNPLLTLEGLRFIYLRYLRESN